MITSAQNAKLKWVRQLLEQGKARREARAFVVEGVRLVEEAQHAGWTAELVLFSAELSERGMQVVERFAAAGTLVEEVMPKLLRSSGDTESGQGLLAVLAQRTLRLPERVDFLFIPDQISDPGNLGTMLRTCAAAGVQAVLTPAGTTDPWAPKVVRAGMGAHFQVPILAYDWQEIAKVVKDAGLQVYLAAVRGGVSYTQADLRQPLALIVGSEAHGAGQEAQALAQEEIHIPMPGASESLNAAVAAGILLFETTRQRSKR